MVLRKKYHPAWTRRKAISQKIRHIQFLYKPARYFYKNYCNFTSNARASPSFYLIGMSASGTSSFFMNLIKHPQIYPPVKKETRFFNHNFEKGMSWYKANFPLKILMKPNQITGEGTPAYMDYSYVPERIKNFTPNAKFIILIRNPIDRAFSSYHKRLQKGFENLSFEKAIDAELDLIKNDDNLSNTDDLAFFDLINEEKPRTYLRRNMYSPKIEKWFQTFGNPDQFLILETKELKKHPQETYDKAFKYLGLKKFKIENLAIFNVQSNKQQMLGSTRKMLQDFFKPYNERLYEFLGKRFEWD